MAYQVVTKSNHTFWLMTSNGNWVSSHHSRDEAIAACQSWFKCSPVVRQIHSTTTDKKGFQQSVHMFILKASEIVKHWIKNYLTEKLRLSNNKNHKRVHHELRH